MTVFKCMLKVYPLKFGQLCRHRVQFVSPRVASALADDLLTGPLRHSVHIEVAAWKANNITYNRIMASSMQYIDIFQSPHDAELSKQMKYVGFSW